MLLLLAKAKATTEHNGKNKWTSKVRKAKIINTQNIQDSQSILSLFVLIKNILKQHLVNLHIIL